MPAELRIEASRIHIIASEDGPAKGYDVQIYGPHGGVIITIAAFTPDRTQPIKIHLDDDAQDAAGLVGFDS